MSKNLSKLSMVVVATVGLFILIGADEGGCEPTEIVSETEEGSCEIFTDCEDLAWAIRCPGEWACQEGECVAVPDGCDDPDPEPEPECTVPDDCEELQWPVRCPGEWACEEGECVAYCADPEPECAVPDDCEDLPWPIRCLGDWACEEGECVAHCSGE